MTKYGQPTTLAAAAVILSVLSPLFEGAALGEEVGAPSEADVDRGIPSSAGDETRGLQILFEELQRHLERAQGFTAALAALDRIGRTPSGLLQEHRNETAALSVLRRQSIAALELFVERYPNDPDFTPDALLRLAELHYEESSATYSEAVLRWTALAARHNAGENVALPQEPIRDDSQAIELTRRIVSQYPRFPHIDAALHLLGLCLYESDSDEEARRAWLHLVCSDHFQYSGPLPTSAPPPTPSATSPRTFVNPYAQCTPVVSGSGFVTESWFRIGESHFDYDYSEHGLDLAIASFQRSASDRSSPLRGIVLYKLAWSYFRADRFPEAIEHFASVVAYADASGGDTTSTDVMVRPEAIQYLAICFTEDDWNSDMQPDRTGGIDRLQDPTLMPQDAGFTPEVYFATGNVFFDLARYSDAVDVYELALRRWPLALEAPHVVERIALAHERNRYFEEAIAARERLIEFGPGGEWHRAHVDANPDTAREAGQVARNAHYDEAVRHHSIAQMVRHNSDGPGRQLQLRRSRDEYELAAQGYRTYLERYPHDPDVHEITYNLAEASYFSNQFREAADAYGQVRDSQVDDRFREPAAFRAIRSLEQLIEAESNAGRLPPQRQNAPTPTGTPPRVAPLPLPELLRDLNNARDAYARLPHNRPSRSASYRFEAALTLYCYGHWSEARDRLTSIYEDHCRDHSVGREAWQQLIVIATALGEQGEVERLNAMQADRHCSSPSTPDTSGGGNNAP